MTSQYRHRRTSNPATPFPNPLEPGEIAVNTSNRQIAVGDAASATLGTPEPLIAVRFFDVRAKYAVGDYIAYTDGILYRANTVVNPGAFNVAQWDYVTGGISPYYLQLVGGTMTGPILLAADPSVPAEAASKHYVDTLTATKGTIIVSDTAPTGIPDNTLWWESDSGTLFIRYNDGNSTQWVIAAPQADPATYVAKTGDTMAGPLILSSDPTALAQAANKNYVDATAASLTTAISLKASLTVADSPPTGKPDGTLWWESDTGLLYVLFNDGNTTQWVGVTAANVTPTKPVLRGWIAGLTMSAPGASATFLIGAGEATDSTNQYSLVLVNTLSKTTNAWVAGNGVGGLDTGTIAANTWYHVYLIKRLDTGNVDVVVSTNASAPSLPANYTIYRRIGSVLADASLQWRKFLQIGDEFLWDTPTADFSAGMPTAATLFPVSTPKGISTLANIITFLGGPSGALMNVWSPLLGGIPAPNNPPGAIINYNGYGGSSSASSAPLRVWTNTNNQVMSAASIAGCTGYFVCYGWQDPRGRNA